VASDSVTLYLDGDPTLDDLTAALAGLRALLGALAGSHAHGAKVTWAVDDLDVGSATGTFLGSATTPEVVSDVVSAYMEVGRALYRGEVIRAPEVSAAAKRITAILNGRVPSVRFETADDEVVISSAPKPSPVVIKEGVTGAYGAVLGRIQTLTNRGSLRFTLYDLLHDRAVACYLQEGQEGIMRNAWGSVALVAGWVRRDPATGRPTTIRRIRDVQLRPEGAPGEWRDAIGAFSSLRKTDERAETTIRRLRDAQ
jgi:hypothetical protein